MDMVTTVVIMDTVDMEVTKSCHQKNVPLVGKHSRIRQSILAMTMMTTMMTTKTTMSKYQKQKQKPFVRNEL
jgi:hypothetical protein